MMGVVHGLNPSSDNPSKHTLDKESLKKIVRYLRYQTNPNDRLEFYIHTVAPLSRHLTQDSQNAAISRLLDVTKQTVWNKRQEQVKCDNVLNTLYQYSRTEFESEAAMLAAFGQWIGVKDIFKDAGIEVSHD